MSNEEAMFLMEHAPCVRKEASDLSVTVFASDRSITRLFSHAGRVLHLRVGLPPPDGLGDGLHRQLRVPELERQGQLHQGPQRVTTEQDEETPSGRGEMAACALSARAAPNTAVAT